MGRTWTFLPLCSGQQQCAQQQLQAISNSNRTVAAGRKSVGTSDTAGERVPTLLPKKPHWRLLGPSSQACFSGQKTLRG